MKIKVLIVAYDYSPLNSIGSMRPESWFRYMHLAGVYPYVVTRHWDEKSLHIEDHFSPSKNQEVSTMRSDSGSLIRVPFQPNLRDRIILKYGMSKFRLFRKFLTFIDSYLKFLSTKFDNTSSLYFEAEKLVKSESIDFIIATGEPWINFRYAWMLHKKYGIPWAPDYRDCWNSSTHREGQNFILRSWNLLILGTLEKRYSKSAKCILAANPQDIDRLKKYLPGKHHYINILNGYDEDAIAGVGEIKQKRDKFRIAHAGTIYPFQKLELFLNGFRKFVEDEQLSPENVEVIFYGAEYYSAQLDRIRSVRKSLMPFISTTPRLPFTEVLKALKESNLLLILANKEKIWLPAKLFESIGLKRKILVVENDHDVIAHYIKECEAGILCDTPDDVADALSGSYREFIDRGEVTTAVQNHELYSRKLQAIKLAESLTTMISR